MDRQQLILMAKQAIQSEFTGLPNFDSPELSEKVGCFVTLHKQGDLRGCIGYITSNEPLNKTLKKAAVAAAFHDPRFPPLEEKELPDIDIEVSILSRPEKIQGTTIPEKLGAIEPGKHGIIIQQGMQSGLLLPQVFDENTPQEEMLSQTCEKAGLKKDSWKEANTHIYTFSATVYKEE